MDMSDFANMVSSGTNPLFFLAIAPVAVLIVSAIKTIFRIL